MTKSEDDLFKHLLRISESSSQDEGGHVFMAMDFSSWCTSLRFEGVTPLFEELDRLLGVKDVMAYTQLFPLESILLFQDRFHPPKQGPDGYPLNGPRCVHGPEAWMEGLRQKGWTLATLLLILVASWKCGTIATLTGQGDNQVIYLRSPSKSTLEGMRMTRHSYIKWFQETLLGLCTQAGITLKLEETWVSSSLLEYGREFFFKGAQVSSSLKRISRISSEANQTIPSFNSDIAGIYSTGMSAAQKDHTPISAFWTTVLEASIAAHERFPELNKYPPEYVACLLSVPRTLGGWPITLFANFSTRSVQDALTCALHLVRTLLQSPRHRQHMLRIAITRMKSTDPTMLIKDPQSLPLILPRQPENYLKSKIAEGLPSIIKNKELTPLFSPTMEENKKRLVSDLMAIRPCNPKLMSKLMTLSNVGKQEALVNKFSSTRSIQNVACREWSSETEVLRDVRAMERTMMDHILSRGVDPVLFHVGPGTCLTQLAQKLRETGWGIQLEGVTMPAQQEQAQVCKWDNVPLEMYDKTISLMVEGDSTQDWNLTRGPVPPYIGAPTRIRAKRQPLQEMESYSFTQSLSQALQLRTWVKGDEGLTKLIDSIIQEKTDASEEELDRRTSHVYSGSLTHRLPCPTMSRGGQSNSTSNFASHIRISSSTATAYAKKGEDYTICFQAVFLHSIASLNIMYQKYGSLPPRMAVVLSRGCCVWTIPPEVFSLDISTYQGVPIPSATLHIEPMPETQLPYNPPLVSLDQSYAAHMAYKFAVWILNRRDTTHISTLERRAVDDVSTPPFINLSEACRLHVEYFFEYLASYLVVLDISFSTNPNSILNELRKSPNRTGFDGLIDTIILSGLTHSFCSLIRSSPIDLQDRDGWRRAVSDRISYEVDKGVLFLANSSVVLIPEETRHLFTRWFRTMAHHLRRRVDPEVIRGMSGQEMRDLLNRALPNSSLNHIRWPPMAMSEEESIAGIRRTARPCHRPIRPIAIPPTPLTQETGNEDADPELEEAMWCVAGGRVMNQLYEAFVILKDKIKVLPDKAIRLYTLGDNNGAVYSMICHILSGKVGGGFPYSARGRRPRVPDVA
ncbi:unnamed protein product [Arctia plantaginis]|uniref:RdRp catalytic domain-containing protein n=1 Tax=Arctia plantaginis TaxID=874455 RepID=A0A8S0ZBI7_ARCPL|nr:unnamed protein product [Arctia plantaginis]